MSISRRAPTRLSPSLPATRRRRRNSASMRHRSSLISHSPWRRRRSRAASRRSTAALHSATDRSSCATASARSSPRPCPMQRDSMPPRARAGQLFGLRSIQRLPRRRLGRVDRLEQHADAGLQTCARRRDLFRRLRIGAGACAGQCGAVGSTLRRSSSKEKLVLMNPVPMPPATLAAKRRDAAGPGRCQRTARLLRQPAVQALRRKVGHESRRRRNVHDARLQYRRFACLLCE